MADIMVTLQKLANENTAKTFKYNTQEANAARKWQTEMSNTSHQREVKDLIAAGLNPVLSSGGQGAQSYSTQSASGVADSAVNAIGNVSSSRTSASAMRYAADQSLKAAQSAAYAQMYAADRHYEATKYSTDHQKVNSWFGLADKYIGENTSLKKLAYDMAKGKTSRSEIFKVDKNTPMSRRLLSSAGAAFSNLQGFSTILMPDSYYKIKSYLKQNGFPVSNASIGLVAAALWFKHPEWINRLKKKHNSAVDQAGYYG